MIKSVVQFSIQQKVFFNLVFILLTVAGFFALTTLPTERYPNFNFGEVTISTHYPGASAVEVESLVTRKIEEGLEEVENIERMTATSYPERSQIRIKFIDDSNYDELYIEVRLKVLNMIGELPEAIDPPEMDNVEVNELLPVITVNLGGSHHNRALALMAKQLKTSLQVIPDVRKIKIIGEYKSELHINLDPEKLRLNGISFDQVTNALQSANVSMPAGSFKNSSGDFLIKVDEKFYNQGQVLQTIIRRDGDGGFIRLENLITKIAKSYRDPATIYSVNGENVISLRIIKTSAGDSLKIKSQVENVLHVFKPMFEREKINNTLTDDSTIKISEGISTLSMNLLAGMLLVSLIIWFFMGIRNAGLITIGIPFSFLTTMIFMKITGNSLNDISLFSFVLVSGIVVDDAIIVCENIYRHVQKGIDIYQAIIGGVSEVALPVIASTLTTIAAFLPMLMMSGSTGEFFALIPIAVSFALVSSLIECLLILPIHYLDFGPHQDENASRHPSKADLIINSCYNLAYPILLTTLKHRWKSVITVILLLIISFTILAVSISGMLPLIKIKFFPDDYSIYYINVIGPSDTPMDQIDQKVKEISKHIMSQGAGYAKSTSAYAGYNTNKDNELIYGKNRGSVMVDLPPKEDQLFAQPLDYLEKIRKELQQVFAQNGYTLTIHAQKDGPPTGKDINIRIVGSKLSSVSELADEVYNFLTHNKQISPYLIGLEDDRGESKRVYRFDIHHDRVHEYNLDSKLATRLAGSLLDGRYIGKYRLEDDEIDIKVLIDPNSIKNPHDALNIPFIEHSTGPIRLGDVASIRTYKEPSQLHRYQNQRSMSIKANLLPDSPTSTPAIVNSIKKFYAKIKSQYPGTSLVFSGEHEDTQKSYLSLAHSFIIAIILIYIVLAAQFQSYIQPFIILSAIIFALIGVIMGKFFTQSVFTVNSFIAVIGVTGIVVNDSLMLIDFMNKQINKGRSRMEAIEQAVSVRFRPILLTTLTTTLGLLPMALGIPEYSPVWGSMASTFVTGLASATLLTLFIVPVLWDLMMDLGERFQKIKTQPMQHL